MPLDIILYYALSFSWPLFALALVIAGGIFVRALPRSYNWSFLFGSLIIFSMEILRVIPGIQLNLDPSILAGVFTSNLLAKTLGGILISFGILGNAFSYKRMAEMRHSPPQ